MASQWYDDERITAFGLFAEAYTGLMHVLSAHTAGYGLAVVEFEALIRLVRSPGHRLRMSELAGQMTLTSSGITRVVDRLERDGLVRRESCPDDRRGSWAVVTDAGMSRVNAVLPGHLDLLERHFTGRFPPAERAALVARLREIRDDVHPAGAAPAVPR